MLVMATLTVMFGAYLSTKRKLRKNNDDNDDADGDDTDDADESVELECHHVACMPLMSSVSLLVLFLYWKYVSYLIIGWISFTAWAATFEVCRIFLGDHVGCAPRLSVLAAVGASVTAVLVWASTGSFVMHDVLGCSICVCCIAAIRFPSMKLATLCLSLLLLYDIFWVFYSSRVFHDNVMVSVATKQAPNPLQSLGASCGIKVLAALKPTLELPIKLLWPSTLTGASGRYMMLGLGDIVLPGLFVALALRCDLHHAASASSSASTSSSGPLLPINAAPPFRPIYTSGLLTTSYKAQGSDRRVLPRPPLPLFFCAVAGYAVGLVAAFAVGFAFKAAQPALIYLVPGVLLPVAARAWWTGRLLEVWNGPSKRDY